jgi:hypothetical protein
VSDLNIEQVEAIATRAADEAVRKMLLLLGVDASDDKAILEMQADFKHVRTWRTSIRTVKQQSLAAAIKFLVPAAFTALVIYFGFGSKLGLK